MSERSQALGGGGGPAGATAACLLARAGWSVAVVERKAFPRPKVCGEYLSATNWPLLESLGIARDFAAAAGPDVRRVGLLCGAHVTTADLPSASPGQPRWGRALCRERLDSLLLAQAASAGAIVHQPCEAVSLEAADNDFVCGIRARSGHKSAELELRSPVVIAAHGSWDVGPLPTQPAERLAAPHDLFGFKAHFQRAKLPPGVMPLISFPGGYGGMVHTDGGRVSLSCCVRRDVMARFARHHRAAGDALCDYLRDVCPALATILSQAQLEGRWSAAGPIRPGIRHAYQSGIFTVGNAAGEAHPVVAEGITMAMQSAWLLSERLIAAGRAYELPLGRDAVGADYQAAWRRAFAGRIRAAAAVANWAMCPLAVRAVLPLVRRRPGLLTWGARASGKTSRAVTITTRNDEPCSRQ